MQRILNLLRRFASPLRLPDFLLLTLILVLPEAIDIDPEGRGVFYIYLRCIGCAYLWYLPATIIGEGKRFGRIYRGTVFSLLTFITAVESLLVIYFHTPFNPYILDILRYTDPRESLEFIRSYCLTLRFALLVSGCVLAGVGLYAGLRRLLRIESVQRALRALPATLMALALFLFAVHAYFVPLARFVRELYTHRTIQALTTGGESRQRYYTSLDRFLYSWYISSLSQYDIQRILKSCKHIELESCEGLCDNIVLIIGESFNKHHSELYGYPLATNPELRALRDSGSLFVFNDVLSPYNTTSRVLKPLLSFASGAPDRYWADTPLLPAVFRKAGYRVTLLENQVGNFNRTFFGYSGGYFMYNKALSPLLYDAWNDETSPYDLGLLDDWERMRDTTARRNFVIFHLMGQHASADMRYPAEFARFQASDIRTGQPEYQRDYIAAYANATLYNDHVVAEIIRRFSDRESVVVYLSDHGEEVYDYRDHLGRTHERQLTPDIARNQYEIPMMICVSGPYARRHPEVTERIRRATTRPFLSDATSQLLAGLAGIRLAEYDPQLDPLDDRFDSLRPRMLLGTCDYDALMNRSAPTEAPKISRTGNGDAEKK